MATLSENIIRVDEAFKAIKSAINNHPGVTEPLGECASPEEYADSITSIAGAGDLKIEVAAYEEDGAYPTVTSETTDDGVLITFGLRRGPKGDPGPQGEVGEAGKDGKDGMDGVDGSEGTKYEYIYFRGFTNEDKPNTPASGVGNDIDDYVPTETKTVNINGANYTLSWTDKAQGIGQVSDNSPVYMFEWRSERKMNAEKWSDFSKPILWAKYGEKGKDGDGVQYVFTFTETIDKPRNPTPSDWETNKAYQNNESEEYIPNRDTTVDKRNWYDDPEIASEEKPYWWFSIRRYRNGKWGMYSEPVIWDEYEQKGSTDEEITADVVVIDMDPDSAMVNSDTAYAETTIRAYRGNSSAEIQDIKCTIKNVSDSVICTPTKNNDGTWTVSFTNIQSTAPTVYIDLEIVLSETISRHRTFSIYQTQYDAETVSVDIQGENLLIPCADGINPDEDFFPVSLPMSMRVNGELVPVVNVTCDTFHDFTFESNRLIIKSIPEAKQGSMKFAVTGGGETGYAYVSYTKFDTKGGAIAMYSLMVNANDIVCDTRNGKNEYTVYSGKQGVTDNRITANVLKYTNRGNLKMDLSELTDQYRVVYANDPQEWFENESSTVGEYRKLEPDGIVIGEHISPDQCVSFQLREWVGEGTPWSTDNESDYIVWKTENILVDIIRDVASYRFVVDPAKVHRNAKGELVDLPDNKVYVGISRDVAGDDVVEMEPLSELPTGYDLYYAIDDNPYVKVGGESENVILPYGLDVTEAKNAIKLRLVVDEESADDEKVVLSEIIEVTSETPGKSAYIGYLSDSLGVISCNADGNPTVGQELSTTFKITNGSIKSVRCEYEGSAFAANCEGDVITFSDFNQALGETTKVELIATYLDDDDIESEAAAIYTIVKLKISESSTTLNFGNDNIIVPCDETYQPLVTSFNNFVSMTHGDEFLSLTTNSNLIRLSDTPDENGCYSFTINIENLTFNNDICELKLLFVGTDKEGKNYNRLGQLTFVKVKAGESGRVWDLVLSNKTPKFNNNTDKFDNDYISGHVNIWGKDEWSVATYNDIDTANRVIVYAPTEEWAQGNYSVVSESSFDDSGNFVIYVNPQSFDVDYVDIDQTLGATIGLAEVKEDGSYEIIQEEVIEATYDGRDFSKFELLLSDNTIHRTIKNNEVVSVSPNEIHILGVYESKGSKRGIYNGETILENHVSRLDIYYSVDALYDSFNEDMILVPDLNNDGWASNDIINIDLNSVNERLDVYLVAHYDDPSVSGNGTTIQIVDHKELRVANTTLPDDVFFYHMELPQDEIKVPVDDNGVVDPDFTVTINPILYVNDDVQHYASFYYVFGDDSIPSYGWNTIKQFTAYDFSENNSYIWFGSLEHNLYKKCKISKEVNPVEIFIDKNIVKRELGDNLVHDSITLNVKKWNYTYNVWEDTTGYEATLYYRVVGSTSQHTGITSSCPATFNLQTSTYSGINYIKFVITDANGNEKGFEEVGVITDGADGSSREVIYRAMSTEIPAGSLASYNPTPSNYLTNDSYQEDDYEPTNWTDNYPGVSETNRYVYVCERKRNKDTGFKWGRYSNPNLYAKYAEVEVSDEEKNEIAASIEEVILKDINQNIADATGPIQSELDATKANLDSAVSDLEKAIANGDKTAIEKAENAVATANAANTLASNASEGLSTLETAVNNIGTENSSILSLNDLQLLSIAALGLDAATEELFPETDIEFKKNVFAKNIVGLVGTFGTIKAENIEGTTITGKTIQSASGVSKPWYINGTSGAFQLGGSDGITFNGNGNITFGSNVSLTWDTSDLESQIEAAQNTANTANTNATNAKTAAQTAQNTANEAKTAAQTAQADATYSKNRVTRIDSTGIYTGSINASQITAGTIDAARIATSTITGAINNGVLTGMSIYSGTTASNSSWYITKNGFFQFGGVDGIKYIGSKVILGSNVELEWQDSWNDKVDLSGYALKTDLTGFAKQTSVDSLNTTVNTINNNYINSSTAETIATTKAQALINKLDPIPTESDWNDWFNNIDSIDGTKITKNSISTDQIATINLSAANTFTGTLAAGYIDVANLTATKAKATSGQWELKNDGSATFANGNIKFNANGTWTLGNAIKYENDTVTWGDVKVKWGNVTDNNGNELDYEFDNGAFHTDSGDIWTGSGNIYTKSGNIAAYDLSSTSDMRLKTPVKDINLTVDQIADAPAFVFDWNETGRRSLGSSAQYWQKILPEGVGESPDGYLNMQYGNVALVALINLAKEVKELKAQVASLQDELKGGNYGNYSK